MIIIKKSPMLEIEIALRVATLFVRSLFIIALGLLWISSIVAVSVGSTFLIIVFLYENLCPSLPENEKAREHAIKCPLPPLAAAAAAAA